MKDVQSVQSEIEEIKDFFNNMSELVDKLIKANDELKSMLDKSAYQIMREAE